MGRHNHENAVAIPGFRKLVVLSGDDTFTSGALTVPANGATPGFTSASQSQLYSYIARDTKAVLTDKGDLWAFVSDTPGFDDYYDFAPGSSQAITGHFIKVPKNIATGRKADGSPITSADVGYPAPPTDGSWQRDLRSVAPVGIDGPQWVLEYWSQINNVFDFVRVEDIAYDKRHGMGNVGLRRRLRSWHRGDAPGRSVHQRTGLEDGARQARSQGRDGDEHPRRGGRQRGQDPRRRSTSPTTSSPRSPASSLTEDPGARPAVPGGLRRPERARPADFGTFRSAALPGRRQDRPVRRRRADRRGRARGRQLGCLETTGIVDAISGLRPRSVPHQHPGAYVVGREGGWRRQCRPCRSRLHVQA